MNIEVGEYIRDKNGFIIKVNEIQEYKEDDDIWYEQEMLKGTWRSMVLKHSKNIIDLIEVGDYVNGELIREISPNGKVLFYLDYDIDKMIENGDIERVLTKEQFKEMEYRIDE